MKQRHTAFFRLESRSKHGSVNLHESEGMYT